MSLIYQALRQTEQHGAAVPVAAGTVPPSNHAHASAAPASESAPAPSHSRAWWWLMMLGGLVAAGVWLAVGKTSKPRQDSTVAVAAVSAKEIAKPVEVAKPVSEVVRSQVEAPLPTALRKPVPVVTEREAPVVASSAATVAVKASPAPVDKKVVAKPVASTGDLPAPAERRVQAQPPITKPTPVQAEPVRTETAAAPRPVQPAPVVKPVSTEPAENMAVVFDRFNRALAEQDHGQARTHLDTIQANLPPTSLARWRAEAWFAQQTGDLDRARETYLGLLDKLPGDENATLNLVTIEHRLQHPERARVVLERSLRHNPDSVALRAAVERLNQSGVAR